MISTKLRTNSTHLIQNRTPRKSTHAKKYNSGIFDIIPLNRTVDLALKNMESENHVLDKQATHFIKGAQKYATKTILGAGSGVCNKHWMDDPNPKKTNLRCVCGRGGQLLVTNLSVNSKNNSFLGLF